MEIVVSASVAPVTTSASRNLNWPSILPSAALLRCRLIPAAGLTGAGAGSSMTRADGCTGALAVACCSNQLSLSS